MSVLAQSGHPYLQRTCPLSGVKQTWRFALHMSAYDPKRTSVTPGIILILYDVVTRGQMRRREFISLFGGAPDHSAGQQSERTRLIVALLPIANDDTFDFGRARMLIAERRAPHPSTGGFPGDGSCPSSRVSENEVSFT